MHADGDWQTVERVLSRDMATVGEYLQTWKLKLSATKAVLAVFHLNNKDAKRELKVNHNNETLLFWSEPTYLGALAYGGGGHCAVALPSDPKNKKCINSFRQCIPNV